jgi:CheY-like chemotaxis protein
MTGPIHHYSDLLIVDDSKALRAVARRIFGPMGFKSLEEASDGEQAFEKIYRKGDLIW